MSLLAANYVNTCQMCGSLYKFPVYRTAFAVNAAKLFTELCGTSHGNIWPLLSEHERVPKSPNPKAGSE